MPRLTTTDSSIQARRALAFFGIDDSFAAHQSTTVDTHSRITNGGFQAA